MPRADVLADCFLDVHWPARADPRGKKRAVNVFPGITFCPADHDATALLVPFEHGARPNAEFPANLGGHRNLTVEVSFDRPITMAIYMPQTA